MHKVLFTLFARARLLLALMFAAVAAPEPSAAAEPADALKPMVRSLRIGDHGTMWRVVLDVSAPVLFRAGAAFGAKRVIVDLGPVEWRAAPEARFPGQGLLEAYRFAPMAEGGGRLTVFLRAPARIKEIQALDPRDGAGHRLVMDLESIPEAARGEATTPAEPAGSPPLEGATAALPLPPPEPPRIATGLGPSEGARGAVMSSRRPPVPPLPPRRGGGRPVIVIDPGHGGIDPGAQGQRGTLEKTITLLFSHELKKRLEFIEKYYVIMTRMDDRFLRLRERVEMARRANADLFISVHADSLADVTVRGASVYTLSDQASDKEAEALAQKENKADVIAGVDLTYENPVVASILIDLAQRETMNLSALFARDLVEELAEPARLLRKTHRFAGFAVLKAPDVPSVLLELGYLSHREEERLLAQPAYRERLAEAVTRGIDRWFSKMSGNTTLSR